VGSNGGISSRRRSALFVELKIEGKEEQKDSFYYNSYKNLLVAKALMAC
jgi:hypothetical protein